MGKADGMMSHNFCLVPRAAPYLSYNIFVLKDFVKQIVLIKAESKQESPRHIHLKNIVCFKEGVTDVSIFKDCIIIINYAGKEITKFAHHV